MIKRKGKFVTVGELYCHEEVINGPSVYGDWYVITGRTSDDFDHIMDQIADYFDDTVLLVPFKTWGGTFELLITSDKEILEDLDNEQ
jgi:hypothetical protein